MPTISKQQPMRPAEIDLVDQVNTNTGDIETNRKNLAQEVTDRTNADTALGNRITQETNRATEAEKANADAIAKETEDRTNADTEINAKFPVTTDNIADGAVTTTKIGDAQITTAKIADLQVNNAKLASNAVSTDRILDKAVTSAKLEQDVQNKLTLVESFPTLTYGESDATTVSANSNVLVDITFPSPLTEAPNVYCMARSTVCIECNVEQVTNSQVSIRLYNNTTGDAESVSIDWLAISGR